MQSKIGQLIMRSEAAEARCATLHDAATTANAQLQVLFGPSSAWTPFLLKPFTCRLGVADTVMRVQSKQTRLDQLLQQLEESQSSVRVLSSRTHNAEALADKFEVRPMLT